MVVCLYSYNIQQLSIKSYVGINMTTVYLCVDMLTLPPQWICLFLTNSRRKGGKTEIFKSLGVVCESFEDKVISQYRRCGKLNTTLSVSVKPW